MDQLIKQRGGHRAAPRAALRRTGKSASSWGPPSTIITATNMLAIVTGCPAPSADAASAPATVTPASASKPPSTSAGVRQASELGADTQLVCAVPTAYDPRRDGGVHRAESQRGDRGDPGMLEVGDVAQADPTKREAPPVPAWEVDLVDHAYPAAVDSVER